MTEQTQDTPDDRLFHDVNMLVAGHTSEVALNALANNLVFLAITTMSDRDEAKRVLFRLGVSMAAAVDLNFDRRAEIIVTNAPAGHA